jgi:hypothetical protein
VGCCAMAKTFQYEMEAALMIIVWLDALTDEALLLAAEVDELKTHDTSG